MEILKIDFQLKALVRTERKITHEILLLIQNLDVTRSYTQLGFSSLFEYLTKRIGYSEGAAQRRISSARLLKICPALATPLKNGELNLTQVGLAHFAIRQEERTAQSPMSPSRKVEIIEKLKNKNTFETQRILQNELPAYSPPQPRGLPKSGNRVRVNLDFSQTDWEKIQALLANFSHKIPNQKIEDLLLYWHQQLEKKKTNSAKKVGAEKNTETQRPTSVKGIARKAIPAFTKFQLFQRSQNQCQYFSKITGVRCQSRHFLEIDHIIPVAKAGKNDLKNLRVLCKAHNGLVAKELGISR